MKKTSKIEIPTEVQLEIIRDHIQLPDAEILNFIPKTDGKSVYIVNRNTGKVVTVTRD